MAEALTVNGYAFDCARAGAGAPVLFVHGSASDRRTWDGQLDALSAGHEAIAYSRRFHWPNAPIVEGEDYSFDQHLDDLEAVIGALAVGPVHMVGHSYGGLLALALAARRGDLVRTLALIEASALTLFVSDPPEPVELLRLLVTDPRTAFAIVRFGARGVGPATKAVKRGDLDAAIGYFGRAVLGPAAYARLSDERRAQARANFFAAELLGSGFPPLDKAAISKIDCPALLALGDRSPALFARLTGGIARLLPKARRLKVAEASHIVHEDQREAFNAGLREFLAGAGADR